MAIHVDWHDSEQTILCYSVSGLWTWEEFYAARDLARQLADCSPAACIDSIIDLRAGSHFPQNALMHFRRMPTEAHFKLKNGAVVIVENNTFVRSMTEIMRRLNRQAMRNFYAAPTLQAARAILAERQDELPACSA